MDQGLLEIVGELVEARVQFFTRNLNSIMHIQRGPALQRFLGIEERYLELVDRLHRSHLRNQLVTNVITLTLGEMTQENVRVTPTQTQIDSGIMNIDTSDSNCAVCQDSITSNGVRIRHCNHEFHRPCLVSWFAMSVRCPVCRHDIREDHVGQTSSVATGTTSLSVSPSGEH